MSKTTAPSITLAAQTSMTLLAIAAAIGGLSAFFDLLLLSGVSEDFAMLDVFGFAQLAIMLVTAVPFLTWFRRVFLRTAEVAPEPLEGLRSRWAVAAWFVPLIGFVFPYVIAKRMHIALSTGSEDRGDPPSFFSAWWGSFVAASICSRLAARVSSSASTAADIEIIVVLALVADILTVTAAVSAIPVVQHLTRLATSTRTDVVGQRPIRVGFVAANET